MNGADHFNPPQVAPEKSEDTQTGKFIEARLIRVAKLLALAVAVTITLLFVASNAGSRIIALLGFDKQIDDNVDQMVSEGRQTFRFDTFGDEAFWGEMLRLHQAIEGTQFGV